MREVLPVVPHALVRALPGRATLLTVQMSRASLNGVLEVEPESENTIESVRVSFVGQSIRADEMNFHLFGRLRIKSRDQLHQNAPPDFAHYTAHGDNENSIRATVAKEVAQEMGTEETTATRIRSFISVLNLHFFVRVGQPASFQYNAAETHFGRQVRAGERLVGGNYEVENAGESRSQRGFIPACADNPSGGLTNHFAPLIKQEHHGPRRFDFLGKAVLHRQRNDGLAARGLYWRNGDRKLRRGQERTEQQRG